MRQQKITYAKMRAARVRDVFIYCSDHRCGHLNIVADDADRWSDEPRISDIEDKFVCTACGQRGVDIRPDWQCAERIFQTLWIWCWRVTVLTLDSVLPTIRSNWSGCPIVAGKWCNLYAINYSPLQAWIEIAHRPLIEINDATRP